MHTERLCEKCGAALTNVGSEALCPACLLEGGLVTQVTANAPNPSEIPSAKLETEVPFTRNFGDYELLEEVARGGMGIVYKARQLSLDRIVAVKMLLFGRFTSPEFVQRFRAEAAAAASLQHPNIVAIHEVGFREGQHFFAMEYIEGRSLAELVRDGPLPPRRAAGYVKTIAEAIYYAHERGILHRDLKPSNVLIDSFDQPKVTDFGLAKRIEKETELTLSGQVLGSPNYMPPEQAAPHRGLVGKRSDIYSLGAVLYHLMTGRPPFVAQSVADTLHEVANTEPVSPQLLNASVPRDLATICLKCVEKEPARRYDTAQELAEELGRFVHDEPILARPASRVEKSWRWCRRNLALASLGAAAALIFLLGFAGVTWQWLRAERNYAERQMAAAETQVQRDLARGRLYAAQMQLAHSAYRAGKIGGALKLLRAQQPLPGQPDLRGFEWRFLYRLCGGSQGEVLATNASGFSSVDYSPDNRTVAFGSGDGWVEIFDLETRQRVVTRWQAHEGVIDDLAFCPQNAHWLATTSGDDGLLKLWDVVRQRVLFSLKGSRGGFWASLAFSPRGRFLVAGSLKAQSLNVWELHAGTTDETPSLTLKTNLGFLGPAAFSPDERTLVVCNDRTGFPHVALYDLTNDRVVPLPRAHADTIHSAAFAPNGNTIATGGSDERVVLWDIKKRVPIRVFEGEVINVVSTLAFAPDGQTLFASSWDQNIRFWDLRKQSATLTLQGHSTGVNSLAISPDGHSLVSAGRDGTVRLWNLPIKSATLSTPAQEFRILLHSDTLVTSEEQAVVAVAVSPDQNKVAAVTWTKLMLYDLASSAVLETVSAANVFRAKPAIFGSVIFSPDGRTLAVGGMSGELALLDAVTLQRIKEPMALHGNQLSQIVYGLDGTVLVTGGGFGTGVKLTEVANGRLIKEIRGMEGSFPLQPLAVSSNHKLLATGSPEQVVHLWDLTSGQLLASSPQQVRFLHSVTFSPDGKLVAFGDELGNIFLWDRAGLQPLRKLVGHAGPANSLAFSPDGRTLASASMDHTIKLWNPEIDQEVATLSGHSGWVWSIAFAEHGNALVSGSRDGTLKIWRALPWGEIDTAEKARAGINL
jgi:WD40 repeat protein/predicted Ser/Thr protein kinase